MGNAIWLFLALPKWYFQSILHPFAETILTGIPASGVVALVLGVIFCFTGQRKWSLLWIMASIALSQLHVVIAGFFRGQMSMATADRAFYGFMFVELVIIAILIWRSRGNRLAASFLAWFGITYAWYAGFIGQMAFTDAWL